MYIYTMNSLCTCLKHLYCLFNIWFDLENDESGNLPPIIKAPSIIYDILPPEWATLPPIVTKTVAMTEGETCLIFYNAYSEHYTKYAPLYAQFIMAQ